MSEFDVSRDYFPVERAAAPLTPPAVDAETLADAVRRIALQDRLSIYRLTGCAECGTTILTVVGITHPTFCPPCIATRFSLLVGGNT